MNTWQPKDYITLFASVVAIIISIISLVVSWNQKNKETKRTIRKNLTDAIEGIIKINIQFSILKQNKETYHSNDVIQLRRNYNSQKRILIAHANYLAIEYDELITDIDCNLLADTFALMGDYEKADFFWLKSIDKSTSNTIKTWNLRGYARYLFDQGKFQLGREMYEQALKIDVGETDYNRKETTDTCLMWANVEIEHNNYDEAKRRISDAKSYCSRIGNNALRKEMEKRIKELENGFNN